MIVTCSKVARLPCQTFSKKAYLSLPRAFLQPLRSTRWRHTSPPVQPTISEAKKLVFPQRLLVYHAGTGRTVFVGCSKVTTFFLFGFFCTVVAPAYYYNPDESIWMVPAIVAAGTIPMLYVGITTKPFTTYVHLLLPDAARASREALMKWLNTAGRNMKLDFTTMRFLGISRTTRVPLADLKHRKEKTTDLSNLVHETAGSSRRTQIASLFGVPRRFHVNSSTNHSKEPKLWRALLERVPQDGPKKTRS